MFKSKIFSSAIGFSLLISTLLCQIVVADTLPTVTAIPRNGFTLDDGRIMVFHGVNEMNKQAPYTPSSMGFTEEHIKFIKAHGFNLIRLGIFWGAIEPNAPAASNYQPQYDDNYLAEIKKTVQLLAANGIYTLLDFHQDAYSNAHNDAGLGEPKWTAGTEEGENVGFPINLFGGLELPNKTVYSMIDHDYDHFWANNTAVGDRRGLQDAYAEMVHHTVSYFKGTSGLLGYEIMNEPFPGSTWKECTYKVSDTPFSFSKGCKNFSRTQLAAFYQKIIPVINQTDPKAIVSFEPVVFVAFNGPVYLPKLEGTNLSFNYHNYNLVSPEVPFSTANFYATFVAGGIPQIMSEFGSGDSDANVTNMLKQADAVGLSWTYWTYANNPTYPFFSPEDVEPDEPSEQGIVRDLKKPLTDKDNVQTERLELLTRPYPQIIAGGDPHFTYLALTHIFMLHYTAGSGAGTAAQTQIFLPDAIYHGKYKLKLINAIQVESADPQILIIQNTRPVKIVRVLLTPDQN